jgi:hypothetical protein
MKLSHAGRFATAAVIAAAVSVGLALGGQGADGEMLVLEPTAGRQGVPASLPRGDVAILQVLRGLADVSGRVVIWKASDGVDTRLDLPRAVEPLDLKSASEILEQAGYTVRVEEWKGKPAYHVERAPRKRGRIARESDKQETKGGAAAIAGDPETGPRIQLYAREEGAGRRFIVILETDSRDEAEEALSLLRAQQRSRAGAKKK